MINKIFELFFVETKSDIFGNYSNFDGLKYINAVKEFYVHGVGSVDTFAMLNPAKLFTA